MLARGPGKEREAGLPSVPRSYCHARVEQRLADDRMCSSAPGADASEGPSLAIAPDGVREFSGGQALPAYGGSVFSKQPEHGALRQSIALGEFG